MMQLSDMEQPARGHGHAFARVLVCVVLLAVLVWLPWWCTLVCMVLGILFLGAYELALFGVLLDVLYPAVLLNNTLLFTAISCGMVASALVLRPLLHT